MSDEFKHESLQDPKSIGQYLRAIVDGLEAGHIELSDDQGKLDLEPAGLLGLEVRAKRKGSRVKFRVELGWTEDDRAARARALRIRSTE